MTKRDDTTGRDVDFLFATADIMEGYARPGRAARLRGIAEKLARLERYMSDVAHDAAFPPLILKEDGTITEGPGGPTVLAQDDDRHPWRTIYDPRPQEFQEPILYRPHRGSLSDAMAEVVTVDDFQALLEELMVHDDGDVREDGSNVVVEKYGIGIDERIGWDTHIVLVNNLPYGFTSGPISNSTPIGQESSVSHCETEGVIPDYNTCCGDASHGCATAQEPRSESGDSGDRVVTPKTPTESKG